MIGVEQRVEVAQEIRSTLDLYRDRRGVTLRGFGNGEVIFSGQDEPIQLVVKLTPLDVESERELYTSRGFTPKHLKSGLTAVVLFELVYRNELYQASDKKLGYYNISGLHKVVRGYIPDKGSMNFQPSLINPMHIDPIQRAIEAVAQLSSIPHEIIRIFGSYEEFMKVVGGDLGMTQERRQRRDLYEGGLKKFVKALELKTAGQLDQLVESPIHTLRDSLDRAHLKSLFEAVSM